MDINELVGFGITKTEAKVYLELVKLGKTTIGSLIKRTALHRGTVYNSINNLIKKGFVSFVDKDRVRNYRISGEKIFGSIIEDKNLELKSTKEKIQRFIHEVNKAKEEGNDNEISVYHGIEAFKSLFLEIYDECKKGNIEYLFQGKGGEMVKVTGIGFYKYSQKLKRELKVKCRIILDKDSMKIPYYVHAETKYLDVERLSPVNFWVYGKFILIVLYGTRPLMSIKIKSMSLADAFRASFENLWNVAESDKQIFESRHKINLFNFMEKASMSLDILDIVCFEMIHEGRKKILELLKEKKRVRVLIGNPRSIDFKKRVHIEEQFIKNLKESRISFEWKSTIANLKDIFARVNKSKFLEVRMYGKKVRSTMIIDNGDIILHNPFSLRKGGYGGSNKTTVLYKHTNRKLFEKLKNEFEELWNKAKPIDLNKIKLS